MARRMAMDSRVNPRILRTLEGNGVEMVSVDPEKLRCKTCGAEWFPNILPGGRHERGYYRCENGCNKPFGVD